MPSISDIISTIAIVVSILAIIVAASASRTSNQIAKAQLKIEQGRESEARQAKLRGDLECNREKWGKIGFNLVIQNKGQGKAYAIKIQVDGTAIFSHGAFDIDDWNDVKKLPEALGPGEIARAKFFPETPDEVVSQVHLTWANEDGTPG